jgi:ubiquinone/menaquinone biosynthesis C-methylase UbiE
MLAPQRSLTARALQAIRCFSSQHENASSGWRLFAELAAISGALGFGAYLEQTGYMQRRKASEEVFEEQPVAVDRTEYPDGLNANFLCGCQSDILGKFSGPGGRFENTELRDIAANLDELIKMLNEEVGLSGKQVLDVGAGTGLFLSPLIDATGNTGSYHAVEISDTFVKYIEERIGSGSCCQKKRASVSQCSDKSALRPENSADLAIICDVYHHFEYPLTFMRDLHKTLAPGGVVVILDFHRDDARMTNPRHKKGWVYRHVRAGQEVFREEVESVGFKCVAEPVVPGMDENYVMIFEKKGSE